MTAEWRSRVYISEKKTEYFELKILSELEEAQR